MIIDRRMKMRKLDNMTNRYLFITLLLLLLLIPVNAQTKKQEKGLKREVTLYNPYKPSLPEVNKRSFLPDMNDTTKVNPDFKYDIKTTPFMPEYLISPIKAASLLPDPLPKLYRSYVNVGFGNYITPLAEISITNERSKKGALGFYARHFSTNGKIRLDNDRKIFAGYMDNDVSLFGKKFFRKSLLEGSLDFNQKIRYAYGYDTSFVIDYDTVKKDIRMGYNRTGAKVSFSSSTLDSTDISYDFDLNYNFFYQSKSLYRHYFGIKGKMATTFKGFYVGSGIEYEHISTSESAWDKPKFIASLSPFIKKSTSQWDFKLGFQALLDKNLTDSPKFHLYPDIDFGFNIVPSYINFFTSLKGNLERNDPEAIIPVNPFLYPDGGLYRVANTDNALIATAGLLGNNGMNGKYLISASYSFFNDMVFYSNLVYSDFFLINEKGNHFRAISDNGELLNIHGEISGTITDKLSYIGKGNLYNYSLTELDFAWNKPKWDWTLGLKYNLREKIIAGAELSAIGKRKLVVSEGINLPSEQMPSIFDTPAHFNLNLRAEYRYTKILSFWTKFNNISYNRYYEWAYYPTHRFLFMLGFTYSL
jgi:hypothetical protein